MVIPVVHTSSSCVWQHDKHLTAKAVMRLTGVLLSSATNLRCIKQCVHQPFQLLLLLLLLLLYWGKGHANPVAAHSQRANLGSCDFVPFRSPVSQVRCIGERNSPTSQLSIPVAFYFMGVPSTHQGKPWTLHVTQQTGPRSRRSACSAQPALL